VSGGGGGGNLWKILYVAGGIVCVAVSLFHREGEAGLGLAIVQATGGLAILFGSCEAMILCVERLGERKRWNPFVAGAIAGLASNVPEIAMLGFVVAKEPRVAFVVACLTLHVNALVFGFYSALLPKDESGHSRLPAIMVKLGTDMLGCAAGIFLAMGTLMLTLKAFDAGTFRGEGLGASDLYMLSAGLIIVEVVYIQEMMRRFAASDAPRHEEVEGSSLTLPGWSVIIGYGLLGTVGSLIGGHAVGEFSGVVVRTLNDRGFSEMVGGIVVSLFAGIGSYLIMASAHVKGKFDIALSNVSGAVTQVPYVVLPATMALMAAFAQLGIIPRLPHGGVLAIDLETTSVLLFAFPTMLILWKSISDDGMINKVETAVMVVLFALIIFFLAVHG
jgi:hypothetical protein